MMMIGRRRTFKGLVLCILTIPRILYPGSVCQGQIPVPEVDTAFSSDPADDSLPALNPLADQLSGLLDGSTALNPDRTVYLNLPKRRLFLHTQVACRDCVLEMLCVPERQREHETVLAVRSKAFVVHSGLLALELEPGTPVSFFPDFKRPDGPEIAIRVHWVSTEGRLQDADARSWIRHSIYRYFSHPLVAPPPGVKLPLDELRYDPFNKELLWYGPMTKEQREHLLSLWDDTEYRSGIQTFFEAGQSRPLTAKFVFTGSRWDTIDDSGKRRYAAEDGYLITVANFSSAMIDIAEESSSSDGSQTYEAWTERIPAKGTPVILELAPVKREMGDTENLNSVKSPEFPGAQDVSGTKNPA